jgi:hypothetical protein
VNIHNNLNGLLVAVGVLVVFTVGAFFALGVKSVFTSTASAQLSIPNPGHNYDQIALPEGTWPGLDADKTDGLHASDIVTAGAGVCYTNWNSADCAPGWTAVSTGEWTVLFSTTVGWSGSFICASPKAEVGRYGSTTYESDTNSGDDFTHYISHEPCAICCK